ncbi:PH domain protein [Metarhizium rileyi]|uniref:PH domain protein n=1 Tax=Metarhizium rileyi (strain RCEF 4871) TaxID=1649241 RepID=A0A167KK33_METRR|nr:PH domain protein [Metarhizium rileyi RCEF 4871]TWU77740.1 hypothetical protein ED733_008557 [Metarhizium rileyi]
MTSPISPASTALPSRAATGLSGHAEDAVPDFDPNTTAGLLAERLQAWKHACGYLEEYVTAIEKIHGRQAKEYEKALKVISNPLREGHHFDQSLGGIAGFFENMRSNTQAQINTNIETEKSLKGSVLPILERLHKEIKHKAKELQGGAQNSAKEVEKLRNITQKQIELLGQQTASYDSAGGKLNAGDDPYVVHRGVLHRLSNQVLAENNHHNDLIAVQNNFQTFEAHVIEVFQQAMEAFVQLAGGQGEKTRALYNDMLGTIQCVPASFEWQNFTQRCSDRLANPNDPPRSVDAIQFPNMDHTAVKPLIEGSLERKSRNKLSWGLSTGYYVVTPARWLHEFKDSDDSRADPKPELSVFLPDAVIGSPNGEKFNVKGKDRSGTMSSKFTGSTELAFKAHSAADAQKWFHVIQQVCGATGPAESSSPTPSSPATASPATAASSAVRTDDKLELNPATSSPVDKKPDALAAATTATGGHKAQEAGVTGGEAVPSPSDEKKPAVA